MAQLGEILRPEQRKKLEKVRDRLEKGEEPRYQSPSDLSNSKEVYASVRGSLEQLASVGGFDFFTPAYTDLRFSVAFSTNSVYVEDYLCFYPYSSIIESYGYNVWKFININVVKVPVMFVDRQLWNDMLTWGILERHYTGDFFDSGGFSAPVQECEAFTLLVKRVITSACPHRARDVGNGYVAFPLVPSELILARARRLRDWASLAVEFGLVS